MERFAITSLLSYMDLLHEVIKLPTTGDTADQVVIPNELKNNLRRNALNNKQAWIGSLRLTASSATVEKILLLLSRPSPRFGELRKLAEELKGRLHDELGGLIFLHVPSNKIPYFEQPLAGLDETINKFPSVVYDLEEASRCHSVGRSTACVFHCMRVLEIGLKALARELGIGSVDRTNWQNLIERIESAINKIGATTGKDKAQFYAEAALQFRYLKNAWRNEVMHVHQAFDEDHASIILQHTKEFMEHLASKLSDKGAGSP